ncbi:MAG: exo-alpha-sialidase [bacterium]|nr:exo-alpha-sialidase [Candidatus Kapabacteria bacterium]
MTQSISLRALCALMFLSFGHVAFAQTFTDEARVNSNASGSMQAAPQIQIGPDGRLHVAFSDFSSGRSEIAMATSTDGGLTFSAARPLFPGRTAIALMQRGVQFVVDRRGGFHMVWQENNSRGNVSAMYARSTDNGLTFSAPIFAGADDGAYNQDFPSIAVDSNDNVTIAWIDDRDMENGTSNNTQLFATRSTDRGATFQMPKMAGSVAGGGSCECCNTAIATSTRGDVFISFRGNVNNKRDIHVARSTDGGVTYEVFKAASASWTINACPMTGSSIAVDRNSRAHVVWRDSRQAASGKDLIYYATLGRDAQSCSMDMVISDSPKKVNYPTILITQAGEIVVTFQDTRADGMDVRYVRSINGGNSFSSSAKLTQETSTSRQELASIAVGPGGSRYAVWQDTRRDEGDIFIARDASASTGVAPDKVVTVSPADGAMIAGPIALSWNAPENLGPAYQVSYDLEITDPQGETRTYADQTSGSMNVELFGTSQWRVTARTLTGTSRSDLFTFTLHGLSGINTKAYQQSADAIAMSIHPMPARSAMGATLQLRAPRPIHVVITIVDITGRMVARIADTQLEAREHSFAIGRNLAAGMYACVITSGVQHTSLPFIVQ